MERAALDMIALVGDMDKVVSSLGHPVIHSNCPISEILGCNLGLSWPLNFDIKMKANGFFDVRVVDKEFERVLSNWGLEN